MVKFTILPHKVCVHVPRKQKRKKAQNTMSTSSNVTGSTLGKILAGAFLYDFREGGKTGPQLLQTGVGKLKKYLGQEQAKAFFETTEDVYHTLVCAFIDQIVLDRLTSETKEAMSKLPTDQRILVESCFLKSTGQDFTNSDRDGRWAPPLWKLRGTCRKYLDLSPTEVKPEELVQALKEVFLPMISTLREYVSKSL